VFLENAVLLSLLVPWAGPAQKSLFLPPWMKLRLSAHCSPSCLLIFTREILYSCFLTFSSKLCCLRLLPSSGSESSQPWSWSTFLHRINLQVSEHREESMKFVICYIMVNVMKQLFNLR
jgi:hypothetical protein